MDRDKNRLMILLGNYESAKDITTTIALPCENPASVRDLRQGKELKANKNQVDVTVKAGDVVLLWVEDGAP